MRDVQKDSDLLVRDGRVQFGLFDRALGRANLHQADAYAPFPLPYPLRVLRLKEWQAFQITHERFFFMIALFDAKFFSLVQIKVYDRVTKQKYVLEKKVAPWAFTVPRTLLNSVCAWTRGTEFMRFTNRLDEGRMEVAFRIAATATTPEVTAELVADASATTPMVVSIPFADNRGMYSHKALLPVVGHVSIGDERTAIGAGTATLMTDDHKGYYGRLMTWDWVVGAGYRDGQVHGFNLTVNASTDPEKYHENGFWLGGTLHHLPPVAFERFPDETPPRWRIRDRDGLVDLTFRVEVDGRLFAKYGLIESRYEGPFGTFEGQLTSVDGTTFDATGLFGMGEKFWLKA